VLGDLVHEAAGTVFGRWYVTLFGVVFAWCAVRDLGWRRTVIYSAVALTIGGLAENGSVHLGIPYTRYTFNSDLRGDELFLGDVPLMVPLSYTFMAYFAFSSGRPLASGPWRTRASRPWHEGLLALVLAVWALWILDPVVRLGHRFYLGELFHYEGQGFWFGLPLGSQLGFTATAAVLLGLLFAMTRAEPDRPVDGATAPSPGTCAPHVPRAGGAPRDRRVRHRRIPRRHDRRIILPDVDPRCRSHRRALEPSPR